MSGFQYFPPKGSRIPNIQQVSDAVALGGSPTGTLLTVPYVVTGGPVVLYGLAAQSTSTFISRIFLTWEQCYCDTGPVRNTLLWGSAQDPTWVRPKYIPNNATINFELQDTSGSDNTIRITLYCANALPGDEALYGRGKGFMVYTPLSNAGFVITGNGQTQCNLRVEDWADFSPDAMVSLQTSTSFSAQINFRDTRADYTYSLSNQLMRQPLIFGTQAKPFLFPSDPCCEDNTAPIFRRASNLQFQLQDFSGSTNTVVPMLLGQRLQ